MSESLEKFYYHVVEFQKRHLWVLLFLFFVVSGFFLFFALRLEVDSTLDQQIRPEDDYLTLKEVMANEFGQTDSFFVVVRVDHGAKSTTAVTDLRDPRIIQNIDSLEKSISEETEVTRILSIASVFRSAFGRLPDSIEESKEWIKILGKPGKAFFNDDFSATLMNISVNIPKKLGSIADAEKRINERIEDSGFPLGVKTTLTGFPTLLNRIISLMISDNIATMLIALLFVFFVLLYFFRNISLAVIAVAPVIFSIIWLGGTMSLLGVRISLANASVAAMLIGLGVDYGIHLVNSFDTKIKNHTKKPIRTTAQVVGSALTISFITTFVGFSINLFGLTEAVRVQGLTLALGIIFIFINSMFLIPILLKLKIELLRAKFGEHKWK